jgi:hypothetical protein
MIMKARLVEIHHGSTTFSEGWSMKGLKVEK